MLTNNPLVSVIVPIYNVENYLNKCVKTIISQNYPNLEILLIDDGSTDNSPIICDRLAKKYKSIKVYHVSNSGLSEARNYGIKKSKGKYLFFIDSDDYIREGLIKNMVIIAEENNADLIQFNYQKKEDSEEKSSWPELQEKYSVYRHNVALRKCLDYQRINIMAWNKMYKRELFSKLRFPANEIHEDESTIPYVIDLANKCIVTDDIYYSYLQRKNSIMHSPIGKKELIYFKIFDKRLSYFNTKYNGKYDSLILYLAIVAIQKNIFLLTQIKNFDLNLLKEFKRKLDLYYNALKKNNNTSHSILLKAFLYKYMANIIFKIKSSRGML